MRIINKEETASLNQEYLQERLDNLHEALKNKDMEKANEYSKEFIKALRYRTFALPLLIHFNDKKEYKEFLHGRVEANSLDEVKEIFDVQISPIIGQRKGRSLLTIFTNLKHYKGLLSYKNTINTVMECNLEELYENYIKDHDDIDGIVINPTEEDQPLGNKIITEMLKNKEL